MGLFSRGRHRGKYVPNPHWRHHKCYPNGVCMTGIRSMMIRPYVDANGHTMDTPAVHEDGSIDFFTNSQWIAIKAEANGLR